MQASQEHSQKIAGLRLTISVRGLHCSHDAQALATADVTLTLSQADEAGATLNRQFICDDGISICGGFDPISSEVFPDAVYPATATYLKFAHQDVSAAERRARFFQFAQQGGALPRATLAATPHFLLLMHFPSPHIFMQLQTEVRHSHLLFRAYCAVRRPDLLPLGAQHVRGRRHDNNTGQDRRTPPSLYMAFLHFHVLEGPCPGCA